MSSLQYNYLAKVLLLGEFRVGKSSMVLRYVEDRFPGDYQATIGANFLVKSVNLQYDEKTVKVGLQIWDIGGHARSSQVGRVFFQGVSGALLVYDLTRRDTLDKLPLWIEQLHNYSPSVSCLFLVGNKNDLVNDREIPFEAGEAAKQELNMANFFETSAKTGDHIQDAFENMARMLVDSNRDKVVEST